MQYGFLTAIAILGLAALGYMRLSRRTDQKPAAPSRRGRLVRATFAVGGLAILAILAVETLASRSAESSPSEHLTATVPASRNGGQAELEPAPADTSLPTRLFLRVILLRSDGTNLIPIECSEHELHWPACRGQSVSGSFGTAHEYSRSGIELSIGGSTVRYQFSIDNLQADPKPEGVQATGRMSISATNLPSGGSSHSGDWSSSGIALWPVGEVARAMAPLSLVPLEADDHPCFVYADISALHDGQAVALVPLEKHLRERRPGLLEEAAKSSWSRSATRDRPTPPGLALLGHFGLASLPLLLAITLLAHCFRHRALALCAILLLAVLFSAALERIVIGRELAAAADTSLIVGRRLEAAERADLTFFWRRTMAERLARIAVDPATPRELASWAAARKD